MYNIQSDIITHSDVMIAAVVKKHSNNMVLFQKRYDI